MNFLNERKLPLDVPLGALLLLSETRIACVDATELLSDVYIIVHKKKRLLIVATGTSPQKLG